MSGHTIRNYLRDTVRPQLSEVKRTVTKHEDGSCEVTTSEIDLHFSDQFLLDCHREGNLNIDRKWEYVIFELEDCCISKTRVYDRYINEVCIVYKVPITGFRYFNIPNKFDSDIGSYLSSDDRSIPKTVKLDPARYLYYEGRHYDINFIYILNLEHSIPLKVFAPILNPTPTSISMPIMELIKCAYRNRKGRKIYHCSIAHDEEKTSSYSYQHGGAGWTQSCSDDYLEIDFKYPKLITHIGTAGCLPSTNLFPKRGIIGRKGMRKFRLHSTSKHATSVRIVSDPGSLAWVTSYDIFYRQSITNKWVLLAECIGNSDSTTERLFDLQPYYNMKGGLYTRYLRIRPKEYHIAPVLRVAIYGIANTDDNVNEINNKGSNINDEPLVETIDYVLQPSCKPIRKCIDGRQDYSKWDRYWLGRPDPKTSRHILRCESRQIEKSASSSYCI